MFKELNRINEKPGVFSKYTAADLWTDEYVSARMLEAHLDGSTDPASRNREFMDKSIKWMIQKFQIGAGKKIIDFGCGPGLYTTRFAEEGAEVTGVDFSSRSINYASNQAENKGLDINYVNQDYLTFKTDKKFDLVTLIYCDLCPLSPQQRKRLLTLFSEILKEDGLIVLDVFSINFFKEMETIRQYDYFTGAGFWSGNEHHVFQNRFLYEKEKVMLDKYNIFDDGREREIYNWLQFFTRESIKEELEACGLVAVEIYSDVAGTPFDETTNEMAIVARKIKG